MTSPPSTSVAAPSGAARQTQRLVAAFIALAVIWGVAFNAPDRLFFPFVVVGGLLTGLAGVWVRRRGDESTPGWRITPAIVALAVAAAVLQFVIGNVLLDIAGQILPGLAASAVDVYARSNTGPVWSQVLFGAVLTGGLEEVFWRGAFTPVVAEKVGRRLPRDLGTKRRGTIMVLVSAAGYALFHLATLKLVLVAAAALGGLVWGALLLSTRSLSATVIAHITWTTLMVLFPPTL